jgi:glycosyl transferase family 87
MHKGRPLLVLPVLLFCGWIAIVAAVPNASLFLEGRNDFLAFYVGGKLAGTGQLYSEPAVLDAQSRWAGFQNPHHLYVRLPFHALFLKPLTIFPYRAAYVLFQLLSVAACIAFLRIYWPQCPELLLLLALSIPAFLTFWQGQDLAIVLWLAGVSLALARSGRDFTSGLVLALCAVKPHFFLLVPVVVLAKRRWRILGGAALGGIFLLALSFAAEGAHWPARFSAILENPLVHRCVECMPGIRGVLHELNRENSLSFVCFGLFAGCLSYVIARRSSDYGVAFCLSIAAALIASLHVYVADYLLLL